jgi:hypothetical protein
MGPGIRDEGHSFLATQKRNTSMNSSNKAVVPRASRYLFISRARISSYYALHNN